MLQTVKQFRVISRIASNRLVYCSSIHCPNLNVSGSATWLPICIAKLSRNRHCANRTAWLEMALKSSSVINLVCSYKANQTRFECIWMQSTILVILPAWAVLSLSLPPQNLPMSTFNISTNGKQDVLRQPEANTDLLYFSALSYYKNSVEKKNHDICYCIFALGLSC